MKMEDKGKKADLMRVLEYILNESTIREIDALEAAVERRRRDLSRESGIISLDPERAARTMTESVNKSIDASMDGIRNTFRQFAADLIRKEAPELTDEQMSELVSAWMPKKAGSREAQNKQSTYKGIAQKGAINGIPKEAFLEMVLQFVAYSTGKLSLSEESALRDAIGDWTTVFWKRFPPEIQALVKEYLGGLVSGADFEATLMEYLQ